MKALEDSTALVYRLQVRRRIHEASAEVNNTLLTQTQHDREAADEEAREARRQTERANRQWSALLILVLLMIVVYVLWCRYKAPEMEYIRRRREAVLNE